MSLGEILGTYINTEKESYLKPKDELTFDMQFEVGDISRSWSSLSVPISYTVNGKSHGAANIASIVNNLDENFDISSVYMYNFRSPKESFEFYVEDKCICDKDNTGIDFGTIFQAIGVNDKKGVLFGQTFNTKVKIKRTVTDTEFREKYLESQGEADPKKYFDEVLSDKTKNEYYWGRTVTGFQYGTLKNALTRSDRKDKLIFAIEYLYGNKLPKNTTMSQLRSTLASLPSKDFGIRDVKIMKKFLFKLNSFYISVGEYVEIFSEFGIKPATDLKRWTKKDAYLTEILKKHKILAE